MPSQGTHNIFVERLWRSVKHEDVYLKGYANMGELMLGLSAYMIFYNEERTHQSLAYSTPGAVYKTGIGGGAMIVDKFGGAIEEPSVPLRSTDGSSIAKTEAKTKTTSKLGQRRAAVCGAESTAY